VCTPKSPQCLLCPAPNSVKGANSASRIFAEKRKKRATVEVTLAAGDYGLKKGNSSVATAEKYKGEKLQPITFLRWFQKCGISQRYRGAEPAAHLLAFSKTDAEVHSHRWRLSHPGKVRHAVTYRAITFCLSSSSKKLPRIPRREAGPLSDISGLPVSNLTRKCRALAFAAAASVPAKTASYPFAQPVRASPLRWLGRVAMAPPASEWRCTNEAGRKDNSQFFAARMRGGPKRSARLSE